MTAPSSGTSRAKLVPATCLVLRERDERLESLKSLAGRLAHDFNNGLAPILGYLSLIQEEVPAGSQARQYAQAMEKAARETEGLLETLLLATRPQRRFRPKQCDFTQLVERTIAEWSAALPDASQLAIQKSLCPCTLIVDEAQWQNVLKQLLRNAHFALATGGTLTICLQPQTLAADQAASLGIGACEVFHLVLHDTGFGMSAATLARAFEPFFSTRPKTQGLGLGLTIVHSVVRLHGGQVVLESAEDAGTTVKIWLPAKHEEIAAAPVEAPVSTPLAEPAAKAFTAPGTKVLLVDDDPLVLEVIRACLQRAQFEIYVARDGQEGLRLYQKHAHELALIISDVTMPRLNGIDMVQQIRRMNPAMRVILVSGDAHATRQDALAAITPKPPPLIQKPFTLKDLMDVVRAQLSPAS
jgi:CheY-like chemotaxis protein